MPGLIQFNRDCLIVLRRSLLAVAPEEGCALLLGNYKIFGAPGKQKLFQVQFIWPCCNIWTPGIFGLKESSKFQVDMANGHPSRKTRFALDPKEQINAQRWGRNNNLQVLGTAHSHPSKEAIPCPSLVDRQWRLKSELMVIINGNGEIRSWWVDENPSNHPKELAQLNCFQSEN